MEILLVAATEFEIAPTRAWLAKVAEPWGAGGYALGPARCMLLVTGPGIAATCWHLGQHFARNSPQWAINVGIAGSLDERLPLGAVLELRSERFADLGVEEADGRFTDLFELGLLAPDARPFSGGGLHNPLAGKGGWGLPLAEGLTVQKVHGHAPSIAALRAKYPSAQLESMEGAAFFYACLQAGVPFAEIRSVSNRVEPRKREAWDIPLAINQLNAALQHRLQAFQADSSVL
jgi:futalosine hydrolase